MKLSRKRFKKKNKKKSKKIELIPSSEINP
jgi:hypothetical protein